MKINRIVHNQTLAYYVYNRLAYTTQYLRVLGTGESNLPPIEYATDELKLYPINDRTKELLHIKRLAVTAYDEHVFDSVKDYLIDYEDKMNVVVDVNLHVYRR